MPAKKGSKKADKSKKESSKKSDASEPAKDSKKDETPKGPKFENQFDKMLDALKNDLLHELLEANNTKLAKNSGKKKLVEAFIKVSTDNGRKFFFEKLGEDKDLMKQVATSFGEVDHDSKSRFVTDLKKKYDELGQVEFFKKQTVDTLNKFCSMLGFKEEDSSKDDLIAALGEELQANGALRAFEGMKKEFLVDVAKSLEIESKGGKTLLVKRIVGQVFAHFLEETQEEEEKKDKDSKKKDKPAVEKKPIEKGITSEELYQYYTEELAEYAGKHNLSKSGTKKELIKRIKNFLNMTPEELAKSQEKKKKKRRRPAGAGPKRKTKKSTKEGEQKDAAAKKAAGGRKRKSEGSSASSDSDAKKQKTA